MHLRKHATTFGLFADSPPALPPHFFVQVALSWADEGDANPETAAIMPSTVTPKINFLDIVSPLNFAKEALCKTLASMCTFHRRANGAPQFRSVSTAAKQLIYRSPGSGCLLSVAHATVINRVARVTATDIG